MSVSAFKLQLLMPHLVRPAAETDAEATANLLNSIIDARRFTILDRPVSAESQREFILSLPPRGACHVAVSITDGTLVGMQDIQPVYPRISAFRHVCEIATFVALPARRQGIGASLMQTSLRVAAASGFSKIMASIRADNPDAVAFYQAQGFTVVGIARRQALVRDRYIDEVLAELLLD